MSELAPTGAQLCVGRVMHARHHPAVNRFSYPVFFLRLPLARLDAVRTRLLGIERTALLGFRAADHGPRDGSPLLPWARALLARHGIAADGEIVLHTMPRVLGYVFNPVSFWYCHGADGALAAVLAEVNNTFGERHVYVVAHADRRPLESGDVLWARKAFHVSPFFPVRGEYRFTFRRTGSVESVAIDYFDGDMLMLATRIAGRAQPLTDAALARTLLRFPLLTFGVIARIHWQALRLVALRVPFFCKPQPPIEETTT